MRAFQQPEVTQLPAPPLLLLPSHHLTLSCLPPIDKRCAAPLLSDGGMNLCRPEINDAAELIKSWPDASLSGNRISGSFRSCFF